ncbi:hypothetical protein [Zhongshania sp.]|uniref:hypothetical protein n=1 Tax=Zhongshania sp. TaxID=1971902 RepID=UPI00356A5F07
MPYPLITDEALKKAEQYTCEREERASKNSGRYEPREEYLLERAPIYLETLSKTYSTTLARQAAQITIMDEKRLKSEFYDFAVQYNDTLNELGERLIATSMQRAVGYHIRNPQADPDAPDYDPDAPPYVTDVMGNPVIEGGNDKLALKILEAMYPDKFGRSNNTPGTAANPFIVNLEPPPPDGGSSLPSSEPSLSSPEADNSADS